MSSSKWFAIVLTAGLLIALAPAAKAPLTDVIDPTLSTATSAAGFICISPARSGSSLGDRGLTITVTVRNGQGDPLIGIPPQQINVWAAGTYPFDHWSVCPGGLDADEGTDVNGQTTISGVPAAGGWVHGLVVYVDGIQLAGSPPLNIDVNSPDLNGDLVVDLVDLSNFAIDYNDPAYQFRSDFTGDGREDIADVGEFAIHYGEMCP